MTDKMSENTNPQDTENKNTNPVIRLLMSNKSEGLVFFAYSCGKIVERSVPTLSDLFLFLALIVIIKVVKKIWNSGWDDIIWTLLNNLGSILTTKCKEFLFPALAPHEFIQWMTAGKFAVNIACKEKIPFDPTPTGTCNRRFCRFGFRKKNVKNKLPDKIHKMIPFFKRNLMCVHINGYLTTMRQDAYGKPGELIDWNVHGIKCRIGNYRWEEIIALYGGEPVELFMEIAYFIGTKRIRVEAQSTQQEFGQTYIMGRFHKKCPFALDKVIPHKKGMQLIPICAAKQSQHKGQKEQKYTPVQLSVN